MARTFNLGRLSTVLSLNSQDFRRGLSGSEKQVRDFRRSLFLLDREMRDLNNRVRRTGANIARFGAAAGAGALLGGGLFARQAAEAGTAMAELSLATGLTVETLDRLTRAFEADGVAAQQTQNAIRNFARRVGEAQQGMGTYIRALESAGISQDELASTPVDELLDRFISGLQRMEDPTLRAATAAQFFERAGLQLLAVLSRTPQEFERMQRRAEAFGVVTTEQAFALKDLDQSLTDAAQAASVFGQNLTAAVAPRLSNVISGLATQFDAARIEAALFGETMRFVGRVAFTLLTILGTRGLLGIIRRMLQPLVRLGRALSSALRTAADAGARLRGIWGVFARQLGSVLDLLAAVGGGIVAFLGIDALVEAFKDFERIGEELNNIRVGAVDVGAASAGALNGINNAAVGAQQSILALRQSLEATPLADASTTVVDEVRRLSRELRDIGLSSAEQQGNAVRDRILDDYDASIERLRTGLREAEAEFARLSNEAVAGVAPTSEFIAAGRAVQAFTTELAQAEAQGERVRQAADDAAGFVEGLANTVDQQRRAIALADRARDALGGIFTAAATGAQSFGDILNNVVQRLKALAVEALLVRPILNALFGRPGQGGGLLGGFFQGLAGGAGGGLLGGLGGLLGLGAPPSALGAPRSAAGVRPDFLRNGLTLQFAPVIQGSDAATVSRALNQAFPGIINQAKASFIADLEGPTRLRRAVRGI